jgi:hypothetical protein
MFSGVAYETELDLVEMWKVVVVDYVWFSGFILHVWWTVSWTIWLRINVNILVAEAETEIRWFIYRICQGHMKWST